MNKSESVGLISADRDTKVTLTRTIPRSVFKSSTKDLSLPMFELGFSIDWPAFCCQLRAVTRL